jgi:Mn-dependent DtxR family transcriptional regulator
LTFFSLNAGSDNIVFERDMLISILNLTKKGDFSLETVKGEGRLASSFASKMLKRMEERGLICVENGRIVADSQSRVRMALAALSLGADLQGVSNLLRWQEFEDIAAIALRRNGYVVSKNVRFKHENRRFEIDVVGARKPLVLCIDCKHWHHGLSRSALRRIVDAQIERTNAFANSLPIIRKACECVKWNRAKFVPSILSLVHTELKFYYETPIIPILQLQDFLNQLPAYCGSFKHFTKEFSCLSNDL